VELKRPSLFALALYFAWMGATVFGGPVALTGAMQADLIDDRAWFPQETFQTGMALSQLAPGPLATQLAIYFGWAHSGVLGATVIGLAFVLPSFLMVVAIAMLYLHFGSIPAIQRIFLGVGPAVIAVICLGVRKLAKKNLGADKILWASAALNALATIATETEYVWVILASGAVVAFLRLKWRPKLANFLPPFLVTGLHGPANSATLGTILTYFLKSGTFVFGSGLAIVPFLRGGVVAEHGWLTEPQFLDAVAVAMITPGPVVITVAFIGYLVAGFAGASLAALGTFLPCWVFTVIPAPYFSKISRNFFIRDFVAGVTSAAIGAILGAAVILARHSVTDAPTAAIFGVALLGLIYVKKVPEPLWIVAAGLVGLFL
jgi:chromate transporter